LANLDAALEKFAKASVKAEVLDLRATPARSDFDLAAEVCRRWVSKGKPLFTVQRRGSAAGLVFTSKGDAAGQGMLVVLISAENAGSAEVIAGTLRLLAHAIVIGQKTRGQAVEMTETTLSSGAHLHFAVGEVKLANGETIGSEGVTPDLPVVMSIEATAQILAKEQEQGIAATQAEPERPRLNEAALVAGRNPEIDALENAPRLRVNGKIPHDAALQRALDLVASVAVFGPPKK
jgi:C-terminal processing protease CtpA/Prc